jgi:hypothetical protein
MPYVTQDKRGFLDYIVGLLDQVPPNGCMNYVLFAYCKRHIKPSYANYKNFIGELNETVAEIRRRLLAPYEDEQIKQNGDVE